MSKLLNIVCIFLISFTLLSCKESNPILGTWDVTQTFISKEEGYDKVSKEQYSMNFTEKEISINKGDKIYYADVVKYEKTPDSKIKIVAKNRTNKREKTEIFDMIDDETMKAEKKSEDGKFIFITEFKKHK